MSGARDDRIRYAFESESPKSFYVIIPDRSVRLAVDMDNPMKNAILERNNIQIPGQHFVKKRGAFGWKERSWKA